MGCDQSKPILLVDEPDRPSLNGGGNNGNGRLRPIPSRVGSIAQIQKSVPAVNEQAPAVGQSIGTQAAAAASTSATTSTATPYNRAKDRVDAITETKTIICNGVKMQYAYVSQRGFYPEEPFKANQDAYCIHTNLIPNKDDALFAVFDGHGKDGDGCAIFAKNQLPNHIVQRITSVTQFNQQNGIIDLTKEQVQQCLKNAHVDTNKQLRGDPKVDDSLSGTTAISIYFHGRRNRITVSNVGDSRAVLGQVDQHDMSRNPTIKAFPLSRDQTPYRKDERIRIRATGARVLSLDQLEGLEPIVASEHDATEQSSGNNDSEFVLGDQIDEGGDPPRVWHATEDYPGTAFTRSIGDALAEDLGVFAEPEILTREILPQDRILVIASDGVYEFLTNQSVIDICAKFSDPLEACRAVVAESYELWLQYELRTDDITIICIFIEGLKVDDRRPSIGDDGTIGATTKPSNIPDTIDSSELLSVEGLRPVRKNVSKEKSKAIEKLKQQGKNFAITDDETIDLAQLATFKTSEEKGAIADAIKASIMFRNVTEEQRELIYSCMESIKVKAGTWVIRQGTVGDRFYIVDDGLFEVRIVPDGEEDVTGQGGHIVHQYEGSRKSHAHPSFGELALMHSAPRSASIVAKTDGHLWALHRAAFRQILVQSQDHRKELKTILRNVPYFSNLDNDGINKLSAIMEDITFGRGDTIVEQGQVGTKMFVVESGSGYSTEIVGTETHRNNIKAGMYFGEELLQGSTKYGKTVMAMQTTSCWQLDVPLLKQTMGPLLNK